MDPASDHDARDVLQRCYRSAAPGGAIVRAVTTGMSGAGVWQVASDRGGCALRRWPASGPDAETIRWIHRVLRHAASRGADFVPVPIEADDGRTLVDAGGSWWELAPWMPGVSSNDNRDECLRSAAAALARFHAATRDFPRPPDMSGEQRLPSLIRRREQLVAAAAADWAAMAARAAATPVGKPLASILNAIAASMPGAVAMTAPTVESLQAVASRLQPVVRDARWEHFLFEEDRVTGLIDFGATTIDTPAVDFARLLGEAAGDDPRLWRLGLETSGLTVGEQQLVGPLDASGVVLACGNWLRWIAEGRPAGRRRLERLAGRLERLVARRQRRW